MDFLADKFADLLEEPESNKRRRLYLMNQISKNLAYEHERQEQYLDREFSRLNDSIKMNESLPDYHPTKQILHDHYRNIYEIQSNYRNQINKDYYNMQSIIKNNIREIIYNEKETNNKKYAKKVIKESVSMALGFVPIIGNAKGIIDAIVGKDIITDEELSILGRVYAGFNSLPIIGDFISWENWVTKILKKLFDF